MTGLTDLEVYNSIFNITEENNNFKLYKYPDGKTVSVSYEKVRDENERDLNFSDITSTGLQDDIKGPINIEEDRYQVTKRMKSDKYMRILAIYVCSIFQNFEIFRRTEVDLVEDDIRLVLDEYDSNFITFELQPGIYTLKDISEALFKILQYQYPGHNNVIDIID